MAEILLMVGTRKGAFFLRSDEERRQWRLEGPHLEGWEVTCLEAGGRGDEPVIYGGVGHFIYGPTIHRTRDLGRSWEQLEARPTFDEDSGIEMERIWTVVPSGEEDGALYAGVAQAGLFRSQDHGESWQGLDGLNHHPTRPAWGPGAGGMCCHTVLVDPRRADRLWVGISAVGVFRSDDGGETWEPKNQGLPIIDENPEHPGVGTCVHSMVLDPEDSRVLYQQNHQGVFRSDDAGDSWHRIENGLPSTFGFPMVMHPRDRRTLFTVPEESDEVRMPPEGRIAAYRTTDGGESWAPTREGLPEASFQGVLRGAMSVDGLDPAGVYFGTTGGTVFASCDEGESWQTLPFHLPRISSVTAVVLDG